MLKTPVYLQLFNREKLTIDLIGQLRKVEPKKIYIVCDGPRSHVVTDHEKCFKVRKALESINWECEIKTKFFDKNKGSYKAYIQGVNWLFAQEERAILLEDDDFPHPSFFPFCEFYLEKYQNDRRIFGITGNNFWTRDISNPFFSRIPSAWGWATWSHTWNNLDFEFKNAELLKYKKYRKFIFNNIFESEFYNKYFMDRKNKIKPPNWDLVLLYNCLINGQLVLVPPVNLVKNVGFFEDATHTNYQDPFKLNLPPIDFEFEFQDTEKIFYPDKDYDTFVNKITGPRGLRGYLSRLVYSSLGS